MGWSRQTCLREPRYPIPITIIGFVVFMATDNFGARYFSLFLMVGPFTTNMWSDTNLPHQVFIFSMNGTTYAWIANAIPRPPAKRAAAFAFINSVWPPLPLPKTNNKHSSSPLSLCLLTGYLHTRFYRSAILRAYGLRSLIESKTGLTTDQHSA